MRAGVILTVTQAAHALGISPRRVRQLITARRLPAQRFGRAWMVDEADLAAVATRKPGRPITTGAGLRRRDRRRVISQNLVPTNSGEAASR